jgi:hypothetical protein
MKSILILTPTDTTHRERIQIAFDSILLNAEAICGHPSSKDLNFLRYFLRYTGVPNQIPNFPVTVWCPTGLDLIHYRLVFCCDAGL